MSQKTLDVRVPPWLMDDFLLELKKLCRHCSWSTFVPDVQALVDGARAVDAPEGGWNVTTLDSPFHDGYHGIDDVYSFGDALVEEFPDTVTSFDIGETAEGRPIRAYTARKPGPEPEGLDAQRSRKRVDDDEELEIMIIAGQHAREVSHRCGNSLRRLRMTCAPVCFC